MKRISTNRMRAVLPNVRRAIDCVSEVARGAGLDEKDLRQVQLAVDEACANVVDHAYEDMEPGDMEVSCYLDEGLFCIRVRDWGRGFIPEDVAEPDVHAPLEERKLGGLGLFLIRQVMDQVYYTSHPEEGNELMMAKRIQVAERR